MPYVERVTKAGNTIEIERYFTSRYKKKGISRGDKVKPTKEEQEKVNTRQAERKLRILINANYGYGDYHLVLDYIRRKGEPDRTPEQMRQDIDVFLRECRKEYRKAGLCFWQPCWIGQRKYKRMERYNKHGKRHNGQCSKCRFMRGCRRCRGACVGTYKRAYHKSRTRHKCRLSRKRCVGMGQKKPIEHGREVLRRW